MRTKHKKTLKAIYHNPVLANIIWSDIESLFIALGADVEEGKGSRVIITLNKEIAVFHRPHPRKETIKGAVKSVREFLKIAGVEQC
ncbi:MAG: type II toxin-antitoxin system HicA family toxin [SAR324 cluster bacterium]|nr:type II toxin-antitoxin system HicA family toxin [SAR324 cluster bacterium]